MRLVHVLFDLYIAYHDDEWGVPSHDDRELFEFLILEGAQAGLSWNTILRKRENYREAFDGFDPASVARYTPQIAKLMQNAGIVRNRLKIAVGRHEREAFLRCRRSSARSTSTSGDSSAAAERERGRSRSGPCRATAESDALSKDLKKRGFKFVGSTICYAYMQAVGMVNDHESRGHTQR